MPKRFGAALLGLFVLTAVGCQSGKSLGQSIGRLFSSEPEAAQDQPLIGSAEAYRLGYTPRWSASLGMRPSDQLSAVTVLDDVVVTVQRPTNLVSAINVSDGLIRWQVVVGAPVDVLYEPVRIGDRIYVNTETHLYGMALDSGRIVSESALVSTTVDRPAVTERYAIFGGLNGRVFAVDPMTSQTIWSYDMTEAIVVRPVASGLSVFVTDVNGVYAMFSTLSGEPIWKGRTYKRNSAIPEVTNLGVFLASEDQTLYALNRATGTDRWKYRAEIPLRQNPKLVNNILFLQQPGTGLKAFDAIKGAELWNFGGKAEPVTLARGRMMLNEFVRLTAVDPQTGKTIVTAPVVPLRTIKTGPDDSLILVTENGRLMRLDLTR